jgi:hypothetical protein
MSGATWSHRSTGLPGGGKLAAGTNEGKFVRYDPITPVAAFGSQHIPLLLSFSSLTGT